MAVNTIKKSQKIVIDDKNGLVFDSEEDLLAYFKKDIKALEEDFLKNRAKNDFSEKESLEYEDNLTPTLDEPDEIWEDTETIPGKKLTIFLKEFESDESSEDRGLFHVAVTYMTDGLPSFIYLHFPTRDLYLVEQYQRGELSFDRFISEAPLGALEGDALMEGDDLAQGLFEAMLKVRSESDIPKDRFHEYSNFRELSIEGEMKFGVAMIAWVMYWFLL